MLAFCLLEKGLNTGAGEAEQMLHVTWRAHLSWTTRVATCSVSLEALSCSALSQPAQSVYISSVLYALISPSYHHLLSSQVPLNIDLANLSFLTRFPPLRSACTTRSSLRSIGPLTAGWEPLGQRATSLTRNLTGFPYCLDINQLTLILRPCEPGWDCFLFQLKVRRHSNRT